MRILFVIPDNSYFMPISKCIIEEFKSLEGYEIDIIKMEVFYFNCSYFERQLYKLGYKNSARRYDEKLIIALEEKYQQFQPDCVLVLYGINVPMAVQEIFANYKTILWVWDSVQYPLSLQNFVNFVNEVFCFEYDDIEYLSAKQNLSAYYLPVGANENIYFPRECERDIDISFVGTSNKHRIKILEKVSERACKNNWVVKIAGPFLKDRHVYKRFIFKLRNPHLAKFIDKAYYTPNEAAELYRHSKICLNINAIEHHSLNPRTFEICATNSFQLMNSGQNAHGLMNLDTDLVTFDSVEDLLDKIEFYLANDKLREEIARSGYESVMKNCTMRKSVEKLLSESKIIRSLK